MFRNYISAALGNIGRNGFYAGVTILGLALSFAAAILIGLYLRDEYSFDRFVPGHENVYRLKLDLLLPGQKPRPIDVVPSTAAGRLKLDFPEIQSAARIASSLSVLKIGDKATNDWVTWADPDFFKVMPYPVLAGDPNAALADPGSLVLTLSAARQYFGEDKPIGRTLLVDAQTQGRLGLPPAEVQAISGLHPMRVAAVLDDLPSSSHLTIKIFASGRASFSPIAIEDRHPQDGSEFEMAYLRLKPGSSPAGWGARLQAFEDLRYPGEFGRHSENRFWLAPLDRMHFLPIGIGLTSIMRPSADQRVDIAIAAVGALIVTIAGINFVTLMTARATRRAVEVGVRKATGARRRDLVAQFMGEALIYVAAAMLMAVVAAELTLPSLNAFLGRNLRFDYLGDPRLVGALAAAALFTALLAGAYPALILSSFRPAAALKGGAGLSTGSVSVRQGLVIAQFAILIGLIVMTATIYRQTQFVLNDALRLDTDQVIRLPGPCNSAFDRESKGVAGVKAVACASGPALAMGTRQTQAVGPDRVVRTLYVAPVGLGFFELHGLKPAAGRFFSKSRGEDVVLDRPDLSPDQRARLNPNIVLNESAVRFLGLSSPAAAVGKVLLVSAGRTPTGQKLGDLPSHVIGVVPD